MSPRCSIDSWHTLKTKFQDRFSRNYKGGKITASQITIRQRSSESLHDFLTRFRVEVADIPNFVEELAINYLAAGIDKHRHVTLFEEFFEKNLRTLQSAFQMIKDDASRGGGKHPITSSIFPTTGQESKPAT